MLKQGIQPTKIGQVVGNYKLMTIKMAAHARYGAGLCPAIKTLAGPNEPASVGILGQITVYHIIAPVFYLLSSLRAAGNIYLHILPFDQRKK